MSELTNTTTTTTMNGSNTPTKEHKRVSSFLSPKSITAFVSNASLFMSSTNKKEKNSSKSELTDETSENSTGNSEDLVVTNKTAKLTKNPLLKSKLKLKKRDKTDLRNGFSSTGDLQMMLGM